MPYITFGPRSDVYVYRSQSHVYVCARCRLNQDVDAYVATSPTQITSHLMQHISVGHKVPFDVIGRLRADGKR